MESAVETKQQSFELLKKYGAKWAVLAAMKVDLAKRGSDIPYEVCSQIEASKVKISSGCFSACDAQCDLNKIEGSLIAKAASYGDDYVDMWFNLFAMAMQGRIDFKKISSIPALHPVKSDCGFLDCSC